MRAQVVPSGECLPGYGRVAPWRLCDRLAPFVLAAYARAKPSLLLDLAYMSVLVSTVLHGSLLCVYVVERYDLTDSKRGLLLLLLR